MYIYIYIHIHVPKLGSRGQNQLRIGNVRRVGELIAFEARSPRVQPLRVTCPLLSKCLH